MASSCQIRQGRYRKGISIMTESSTGHQWYNLYAFTMAEELRSQTGAEKHPGTWDSMKPLLPLGQQGPQEEVVFPEPYGQADLTEAKYRGDPSIRSWSRGEDCCRRCSKHRKEREIDPVSPLLPSHLLPVPPTGSTQQAAGNHRSPGKTACKEKRKVCSCHDTQR